MAETSIRKFGLYKKEKKPQESKKCTKLLYPEYLNPNKCPKICFGPLTESENEADYIGAGVFLFGERNGVDVLTFFVDAQSRQLTEVVGARSRNEADFKRTAARELFEETAMMIKKHPDEFENLEYLKFQGSYTRFTKTRRLKKTGNYYHFLLNHQPLLDEFEFTQCYNSMQKKVFKENCNVVHIPIQDLLKLESRKFIRDGIPMVIKKRTFDFLYNQGGLSSIVRFIG